MEKTYSNLRNKYNPDGSLLRIHQLKMLNILQNVDSFCKKYKISYWIADGTLLGAVRHSGFIPWDDDVDIHMLQHDYNRFINLSKRNLPKGLALQIHETDPSYIAPYAKVRDLHSAIVENHGIDKNYRYRGIYIDVFPIDHCNYHLNRLSSSLHYNLLYKPSHKPINKVLLFWLNICFHLLSFIYTLFGIVDKILNTKYLNYTYGSGFNTYYTMSSIFPLSTIEFEGYTFPAPKDPDSCLKALYGNYMELPPESNRITHTENITIYQ